MFSLDIYLVDFVGNNVLSLYVLITLLKGAAMLTKSTKDDKIVTLFSNVFTAVRKGKIPEETINIVENVKKEIQETPQTSDTIR